MFYFKFLLNRVRRTILRELFLRHKVSLWIDVVKTHCGPIVIGFSGSQGFWTEVGSYTSTHTTGSDRSHSEGSLEWCPVPTRVTVRGHRSDGDYSEEPGRRRARGRTSQGRPLTLNRSPSSPRSPCALERRNGGSRCVDT